MQTGADRAGWAALLVGTSRFATAALPPLPAVGNNLVELREVLIDPALGGLPPTNVHVIADPDDPSAVLDPLALLADTVPDVLLVYFAGHGLVGTDGALHLAVPRSTQASARWSAIRAVDVRDLLRDAVAATRVLILDCCFSGRATSAMSGEAPALLTGTLSLSGMVTIASAPANAAALAPLGAQLTAFTGELVGSIRDGDPTDEREYLDLGAVYRETSRRVLALGAPRPQILHENEGHRIPFTRNAARAAGPDRSMPQAPTPSTPSMPPSMPPSTSSPARPAGSGAERLLVRPDDPRPGWTRIVIPGFTGDFGDLALGSGASRIVATAGQRILLLDLADGVVRELADLGGLPWNRVASVALTEGAIETDHAGTSAAAFGPDLLVFAGSSLRRVGRHGTVRPAHPARARGFVTTDRGDLVAVAERTGQVVLIDVGSSGAPRPVPAPGGRALSLALSPQGGLLAVIGASDDGTVTPVLSVLSTNSSEVLWSVPFPGAVDDFARFRGGARRLAFAPHRRLLAVAGGPSADGGPGGIEVREAETGRLVTRAGLGAGVVAFAGPGSESLLACAGGEAWRVDLESGAATMLVRGGSHAGPLGAMSVTREGGHVAFASPTSLWLTSWDQPT